MSTQHPTASNYLRFRYAYIRICFYMSSYNGQEERMRFNHAAGMILSAMTSLTEYWAAQKHMQPDKVWVWHSLRQIYNAIGGTFSKKTIIKAIEFLEEKGYVTKEEGKSNGRNGRPATLYKVDLDKVNQAIEEHWEDGFRFSVASQEWDDDDDDEPIMEPVAFEEISPKVNEPLGENSPKVGGGLGEISPAVDVVRVDKDTATNPQSGFPALSDFLSTLEDRVLPPSSDVVQSGEDEGFSSTPKSTLVQQIETFLAKSGVKNYRFTEAQRRKLAEPVFVNGTALPSPDELLKDNPAYAPWVAEQVKYWLDRWGISFKTGMLVDRLRDYGLAVHGFLDWAKEGGFSAPEMPDANALTPEQEAEYKREAGMFVNGYKDFEELPEWIRAEYTRRNG